ncbi:MAG: T9SS type A sorting domain-containing protein [Ginsengibacter sp.]
MKKIFYILFLIVGTSAGSIAQSKSSLPLDPSVKFIKFYPNPAVSNINFEFQKDYDKFYTFQVYNFIGKKVYDLKTVTPKINVSLAEYYRGVYIYQLRDRTGKILETGKFQVIK